MKDFAILISAIYCLCYSSGSLACGELVEIEIIEINGSAM